MHWFFAFIFFAIAIWNGVVGFSNASTEPGMWIVNVALCLVLSVMAGLQIRLALDDY